MPVAAPFPHQPEVLSLSGGRTVRLAAEIGRGTNTVVYCGVPEGGRSQGVVAVKVFPNMPTDSRERLEKVAGAAACVCAPNVVQTLDFDMRAPRPFIVSEMVDGCTLEALIHAYAQTGRQLPSDLAILIGIKVGEALAGALHARHPSGLALGLVHGSVTARDVLISWHGEVKLADFGHASATVGSSVQRVELVAPRLAAIAPELMVGWPADARSDVFSLGILLHEMLIGPRFMPGTPTTDVMRMVNEGVVQRNLFEPQLVGPLRALLRRATDRDATRRPQDAGVLAAELRTIASLLGVHDDRAFLARGVEEVFAAEAHEHDVLSAPPPRLTPAVATPPEGSPRMVSDVVPRRASEPPAPPSRMDPPRALHFEPPPVPFDPPSRTELIHPRTAPPEPQPEPRIPAPAPAPVPTKLRGRKPMDAATAFAVEPLPASTPAPYTAGPMRAREPSRPLPPAFPREASRPDSVPPPPPSPREPSRPRDSARPPPFPSAPTEPSRLEPARAIEPVRARAAVQAARDTKTTPNPIAKPSKAAKAPKEKPSKPARYKEPARTSRGKPPSPPRVQVDVAPISYRPPVHRALAETMEAQVAQDLEFGPTIVDKGSPKP